MKKLISNAFSLNMLASGDANIRVKTLTHEQLAEVFGDGSGWTSVVGHESTAAIFGDVLNVAIPFNRASVSLAPGDSLLVGQYRGPRLEEGVTQLPEGASIVWMLVRIVEEEASW